MEYKIIEPPKELQGIVKNYFVLEGNSKTYNLFHFADFNSKLFFIKQGETGFCRSSHLLKTSIHNGRVIRTDIPTNRESVAILGPNREYCLVKFEGKISIIGVEFHPIGLWYLLGKNIAEYTDSLTIPNDAQISGISQLTATVMDSCDINNALSAVSSFLISKTGVLKRDADNIKAIKDATNDSSSYCKVSDIVGNSNVSSRQMLRLFKKYIGLSTIQYLHISRFKNVLRLLSEYQRTKDIPQIAATESYFDQSHLTKETKRLTGHTPTVLQETGAIIRQMGNLAIVYEDNEECTFCIYSH